MGFLEKTDDIDAGVIAQYAEVKRVCPTPLTSAAQQRLKALVSRLSQVTGDLTVNKQRRSAAADAETIASLDEIIFLLKRQQRRIEGEIASLIDDDPLWARLNEAFREIKGVASRTVARLMAEVPEIGLLSNKAIAKLVGLAPIANDSGKRQGRRPVRGGREGPRSILFLIARGAAKYDPNLADFYQRLQQAGKPKWSPASLSLASCSSFSMQSTRCAHRVRQCNLTTQIVAHPAAATFSPYRDGEKTAGRNLAASSETLKIGEIAGESVLLPVSIRGEDAGRQMRGSAGVATLVLLSSLVST